VALIALLFSVAGCDSDRGSSTAGPEEAKPARTPIVVQLNWYPEAEHGGLYAAAAAGLYEAAGMDVEIRPGGRAAPVASELVMERCQFAFANADDVVLYRQQGADVVAVLAAMQDSPRCLLVRRDAGVTDFDGLAGMTLQRQAGRPFLAFLRHRGVLEEVREVPYNGSVAQLVASPKVAIQAYSFAEPLLAAQQGVEVERLMVSELGWNPYSSVLVTSGKLVREQPARVRAFVQATRQGWQQYLQAPAAANELILAANQHGMTAEALAFGAEEIPTLALPESLPSERVGEMSLERWQTLVSQMAELGLVDPEKVAADACFTTEFL